ncbi:MAG: 2Fe-2S iron-sulfur cluster-binding protein [Spirochaetota bacterium]
MNISFELNGKKITVDSEPEKRLVHVLREDFGLLKTRAGCHAGECGACTVLYNDMPVPACMLPMFTVRGLSIVTIEGFSKTPEYKDIVKGFEEASYEPCSYCSSGKILIVHALLEQEGEPDDALISSALSGISCTCSDYRTLIAGVKMAAINRKRKKRDRKR